MRYPAYVRVRDIVRCSQDSIYRMSRSRENALS